VLEQERMTLSIEEAAAILGISRALAYELVRRGDLPQLRLGRRIVVPRKALMEFIDAGAPSAPAPSSASG
jgi:excisionase family DNA binding protein